MGQVIDKTVRILKLVASQEHCTLKSLCLVTGFKKSALCQQLRSMLENGLLLRDTVGEYHLGPLFSDLAALREENLLLRKTAESVAADLNTACGENITIATIRNGKYRRLFSCSSFRITRLTATAPDEECFYGNATGRVLLAEAPAELRLRIIDRIGLPSPEDWPEGAGDSESLLGELEKIRKQGYAEVLLPRRTECYIASGCPRVNAGLPVAAGISVPRSRYDRVKFLELLRQALRRFEYVTQTRTKGEKENV